MWMGSGTVDEDERFTPPWRRRSNLMLLAACALVASVAAVPIVRDLRPVSREEPPPPPEQVHDLAAEWDVEIPEGVGEVRFSQLVPGHVLVTGTEGFAVLDPETGDRLWGEEFSRADKEMHGRVLRPQAVSWITSIVNDVLLVRGGQGREHDLWSTVRALDLHSGEERFTAEAKPDHDLASVATVASLVTEDCDADEKCNLTGWSWKDGERKWRHEYEGKATLPSPVPRGVIGGQDQLRDDTPGTVMVPAKSFAVTSDYSHVDIEFTAIELAEGKEVREWDVRNDTEDPIEYSVVGPVLLEHKNSGDSIIDPETGEDRYHLRGRFRYGPHARDEAAQAVVDEKYLLDAYSGTDGDTDAGFGAFGLASLETGEVPFAQVPSEGLLLGGELGTVVTLTGSEAKARPHLRGVDIESGKERWTTALYPKGKRMQGFQSEAVAMFDNHLALTGGPSSWTSGDFFGGARTHIVDLADGRIRRVDDVQVQALGHNAMLGLVNPPTRQREDESPRLAYYEL